MFRFYFDALSFWQVELSTKLNATCFNNRTCDFKASDLLLGLTTSAPFSKDCGQIAITTKCNTPPSAIDAVAALSITYIAFVALAMGCSFPAGDFIIVLKNKLKAVFVGFLSQFLFMPLIAFAFARIFKIESYLAIGLILTGMAPGGTTSNLFTFFVDGNVALSITMSFISTVCAVFMIPLLWYIYISSFSDQGATVPYVELLQVALLLLFPVFIGALIRFFSRHHRCGFSMKYNTCICCCDKRARFGNSKTVGTDKEKPPKVAPANGTSAMKAPVMDVDGDGAVLEPFLSAETQKHDDLGSVNVITPQTSIPGSVVQFTTPFGTRGQATVPWGFGPGDHFVVNMNDPADPRVKDCCFCYVWQWISTIGGIVGVIFLIATIYIGVRDNRKIFSAKIWLIHVIALAFQPLGCLCGLILGVIFWSFERNVKWCRCACGSKNAQRLDCRDLRAISIGKLRVIRPFFFTSQSRCLLPGVVVLQRPACKTHR